MSPRKGKRRAPRAKEEKQKRLDEEKEAASFIEKDPSLAEASVDVDTEPVREEGDLKRKAEERDEYLERLQRTAADFSNYQKRMQREMEETKKYAASSMALDLLGMLDNFHRALEAAADKLDHGWLQGFKMIKEQLLDTLKKYGVKPIDADRKPFDPNFHDALLEVEDASLPDKTVVDELEKGYTIHDRLLRPTKVRVSRIPLPRERDQGDPEQGEPTEESAPKGVSSQGEKKQD